MCIYPRKQQALAPSTTHRLMPEVQFVVVQTDLLMMNLINHGEASRCFSQTVSFILLSHILFLWKVACPYRVRHTFCLLSDLSVQAPLPLDLDFFPPAVADLYLILSLLRPLSLFAPYFPTSRYQWGSSTQRLVNRLAALEQMFKRQSLRMDVCACLCACVCVCGIGWSWKNKNNN